MAVDMSAVARALAVIRAEVSKDRAWWATYDPVAYVFLCRAERRGAIVPWSEQEKAANGSA